MVEHQVQWTAPSPLWAEKTRSLDPEIRRSFSQPAILRFTTDTFMDDFLSMLEKDPSQLPKLIAHYETWRGPLEPSSVTASSETSDPKPRLLRKLERLRLISLRGESGSLATGDTGGFKHISKAIKPMLKLYQPAHQRYYLVTTCLVCGITGMPDRKINSGREEKASFVLRRLLPPGKVDPTVSIEEFDIETWEEHAFVTTPNGMAWQKVGTSAEELQSGEERQPLFVVTCTEDDDRTRRIFAGLIPVGRREAYMGALVQTSGDSTKPVQGPLPKTTRKILFRSQVAEPWKNVIDQALRFQKIKKEPSVPTPSNAQTDSLLKAAREQIQTQSWLVLLDFAKFLSQYVTNVWEARDDASKARTLNERERKLLEALTKTKINRDLPKYLRAAWTNPDGVGTTDSPYSREDIKSSLLEALISIGPDVDAAGHPANNELEKATGSYDRSTKGGYWPSFLFPLADPEVDAVTYSLESNPLSETDKVDVDENEVQDESAQSDQSASVDALEKAALAAKREIDKLVAMVVRAMPDISTELVPPVPLAARTSLDMREGIFVIRTVFERPNCGPLKPTVVSGPTTPFQMAGFFDPDAPARPIRIALPIDTTPAGLRKFDKNTAFMISDVLCGQIQRMKGLTLGDLVRSVLPWPFHKDLSVPDTGPCTSQTNPSLQLGMICSLSIPIVTICALILLMIIVNLLDYVFRWIPYFVMCFPLPGLKAKK